MRKRSRQPILISSVDKRRLTRLLRSADPHSDVREQWEDLPWEIERRFEIRPQDVPADVVTMNSSVRISELDAPGDRVCTIVFPSDADDRRGRVSILAPLGTALLGHRVGDTVYWHVPRGIRQARIDEIVYQPEAAGRYDQ